MGVMAQIYRNIASTENLPVAMGCSLLNSAAPTITKNCAREQTVSSTYKQSLASVGVPWVIVPVLSKTTVLTWGENEPSRVYALYPKKNSALCSNNIHTI